MIIGDDEVGRTSFGDGDISNKLNHGRYFSLEMAGGGIEPGIQYRRPGDYVFNVVADA